MVTSIGWQLNSRNRITGFGARRRRAVNSTRRRTTCSTRGRGVMRNIGASATRSIGTFLVNRLANAIAGGAHKRRATTHRRRTVQSGSYKLSGYGRRPRTHLKRRPRRVTASSLLAKVLGIHKVHRKPRARLGTGLRRRVHRVRRVLF